jgi:tetraacyldisaccharide 4'-kinase
VQLDEPAWWYRERPGLTARVLRPLSHLYGALAESRYRATKPYRARLPVICIGNFTAGGTGKTPTAIAVCGIVRELGREPVFLSRGYRGRLSGPVKIDLAGHTAAGVGDEPLLLAAAAPAVIARDRAAGARFIEQWAGTDSVIIMDDGLQSGALAKDLTLAVVDANRGTGNGEVIPSGPLRAPMRFQGPLADGIILNGPMGTPLPLGLPDRPVLRATTIVTGDAGATLNGVRLVAYAGIANPNRFFDQLESLGAKLAAREVFRDHHGFTESDASRLLALAREMNVPLITTGKDLARLLNRPEPSLQQLRDASRTLAIKIKFENDACRSLRAMIEAALDRRC